MALKGVQSKVLTRKQAEGGGEISLKQIRGFHPAEALPKLQQLGGPLRSAPQTAHGQV